MRWRNMARRNTIMVTAEFYVPENKQYSPEALKKGTDHEMEHTPDRYVAEMIAKHHIAEDSDYYDDLEKIED
jgi:hypothetical protein